MATTPQLTREKIISDHEVMNLARAAIGKKPASEGSAIVSIRFGSSQFWPFVDSLIAAVTARTQPAGQRDLGGDFMEQWCFEPTRTVLDALRSPFNACMHRNECIGTILRLSDEAQHASDVAGAAEEEIARLAAQPAEQQPVGWLVAGGLFFSAEQRQEAHSHAERCGYDIEPVYTHPPALPAQQPERTTGDILCDLWGVPRGTVTVEVAPAPDAGTAANALENCRLFAARHRREEWAQTILRFCAEGGATGSPLRAAAQDAGEQLDAADSAQPQREPPRNAEEVRDFIGCHFDVLNFGDKGSHKPVDDDCYLLSAHDLLASFEEWFGEPADSAQPDEQPCWTLIAPDGRRWTGSSPLNAVSAERNSRLTPQQQLANLQAAMEAEARPDDPEREASELCADLAALRADLPPEAFLTRAEQQEAEEKALIDSAVRERDAEIDSLRRVGRAAAQVIAERDAEIAALRGRASELDRLLRQAIWHVAPSSLRKEIDAALAQGKEPSDGQS